jgi:hypothetical protein
VNMCQRYSSVLEDIAVAIFWVDVEKEMEMLHGFHCGSGVECE